METGKEIEYALPAETDIPAPAITTIFFLFRRAEVSWSSSSSSWGLSSGGDCRVKCSVVRGFRSVLLRLAGGGPSGLTRISASTESEYDFMGDALPEGTVDGGDRGRETLPYEREVRGEMVGDAVRTDSGEDGGSEGGGSESSEDEESILKEGRKQKSRRDWRR